MMNIGLLTAASQDSDWLNQVISAKHRILWDAKDLTQTLSAQATRPVDLLLVQLYDGWSADQIRQLIPYIDCPVLLCSLDGLNHTPQVFAAFGFGARDYVALHPAQSEAAQALLRKIRQQSVLRATAQSHLPPLPSAQPAIIAIGASTGGPSSLYELIQALPKQFPAAVVIVQHLDGRFSAGMVDWLEKATSLKVRLIADHEKILPGVIYIAAADAHILVSADGRMYYSESPQDSLFKPSIDVFFASLANNWRGQAIGVLLTGMGQDGAKGLKQMKDRGWMTIAQDEASSIVYGMPKAAVLLQAVTEVLPLDKIAPRLIRLCSD